MQVPVNLKLRWFAIYAGFGLLLSVIITTILTQAATRQIESQVGASLAHVAEQMTHQLEQGMYERLRDMQIAAQLIQEPKTPVQEQRARSMIKALYSSFDNYAWLGIAATDGEVLISSNGVLEGANVSARPWFQGALQQPYFIGDVHGALLLEEILNPYGGEPLRFVDVAVPLSRADGSTWGVFGSHLNWEWVQELERVARRGLVDLPSAEIMIVNSANQILLGPSDRSDGSLELELHESIKQRNYGVQTWPDGKDYLIGFARTKGLDGYRGPEWRVIIREPLADAFQPINELREQAVLIGLAVAFCFAGIGWISAGRIASPYANLSTELEQEIAERTEELRHTNQKLKRLARTDGLTGLLNRRALFDEASKLRSRAKRQGQNLAVVMLDLDHFKDVNDRYGHAAGDEVLKCFGTLANNLVREVDFAGRTGGEEFTLVLDGSTAAEAKKVTERLAKQFREQRFEANGESFSVSLSAGIASWSPEYDFEQALDEADKLLYEAKEKGRDCVIAASDSGSGKEAD